MKFEFLCHEYVVDLVWAQLRVVYEKQDGLSTRIENLKFGKLFA